MSAFKLEERRTEAGRGNARHARIYTRRGDDGTAEFLDGSRHPKDDAVFEAIGAIDECNSALGVAREHCIAAGNGLESKLQVCQERLFDAGAILAAVHTSGAGAAPPACSDRLSAMVFTLESWIDELDASLEPLRSFILPVDLFRLTFLQSGGLSGSHLHFARTLCRRAERRVVTLQAPSEVTSLLNRMSDFLFVAARAAAKHEGLPESCIRF